MLQQTINYKLPLCLCVPFVIYVVKNNFHYNNAPGNCYLIYPHSPPDHPHHLHLPNHHSILHPVFHRILDFKNEAAFLCSLFFVHSAMTSLNHLPLTICNVNFQHYLSYNYEPLSKYHTPKIR
jgi:hypothetical protein